MIARLWSGWTTLENASAYEALLLTEIFPAIIARDIAGFRSIEMMRRATGDEVEFVTVMRFDTFDAVKAFSGADYETAVVPPKAKAILKRFDDRSKHYEAITLLDA